MKRRIVYLAILLTMISVLLIGAASSVMAQDVVQQAVVSCPGAMPPRLTHGQQARVTPGLPNVIRTLPGRQPGSQIIGQIPGGGVFTVLLNYAPACYEGRLWWYVNYNGTIGWTPEAEVGGPYWTEPLGTVPPPPPPPVQCLATRLTPGGQAQVLYGSANALRSLPRRGTGSLVLAYIPGGGVFNVQVNNQPTCVDGVLWHYVSYNGIFGWTPESNRYQYWVTPYSGGGTGTCNAGLPNRLVIGNMGRVTPGAPNSLRAQASLYSTRIGYIYGGETFLVLGGPVCDNGIPYYRVQTANGTVGWTGEGRWGVYWLEPYVGLP